MRRYTLQDKIKKTYIVVFSGVLLLTTILIYVFSSRIYLNESWKLCEQLVSLNLELLNGKMIEVQNRQEMIAQNDTVKEMVFYYNDLTQRDYPRELNYQRELTEIFNMAAQSAEINSFFIISKEGRFLYFYKESPKIGYDMRELSWYRSLVEKIDIDACFVSDIHDREYLINDTEKECISIVRPIQCRDTILFSPDAYLVCDVSLETIFDNTDNDEMQFMILDNNDVYYSSQPLTLSEADQDKMIAAVKKNDFHVEILNRSMFAKWIAVSMQSEVFGWKVVGVKNLKEITDMQMLIVWMLIVMIGIITIVVVFLSKRVARSVLQPMNILIHECNRIAEGEMEVEFSEKESEEIAFLSDTIQDMIHNIVKLSGEVLEKERKVSEEKLRVLQHQINPHFLNNVLQTIKALAVEGETDKISRISTLLGHILAYSVYEPYQSTAVRTELEYIEKYVELQNIRYENRIICSVECERRVEEIQIPKLTLQPVLENSIEHGLKENGQLAINISTDIESGMICIIVNDNGKGIPEEKLEEIQKHIECGEMYTKKNSIGLTNVNERLQEMYGKEYGISIYSRQGNGTTVIVRIPA